MSDEKPFEWRRPGQHFALIVRRREGSDSWIYQDRDADESDIQQALADRPDVVRRLAENVGLAWATFGTFTEFEAYCSTLSAALDGIVAQRNELQAMTETQVELLAIVRKERDAALAAQRKAEDRLEDYIRLHDSDKEGLDCLAKLLTDEKKVAVALRAQLDARQESLRQAIAGQRKAEAERDEAREVLAVREKRFGIAIEHICRQMAGVESRLTDSLRVVTAARALSRRRTGANERELDDALDAFDARKKDSGTGPGRAAEDSPLPTPGATQQGVATPDKPQGWPVGNVAKPHDDPTGHCVVEPGSVLDSLASADPVPERIEPAQSKEVQHAAVEEIVETPVSSEQSGGAGDVIIDGQPYELVNGERCPISEPREVTEMRVELTRLRAQVAELEREREDLRKRVGTCQRAELAELQRAEAAEAKVKAWTPAMRAFLEYSEDLATQGVAATKPWRDALDAIPPELSPATVPNRVHVPEGTEVWLSSGSCGAKLGGAHRQQSTRAEAGDVIVMPDGTRYPLTAATEVVVDNERQKEGK